MKALDLIHQYDIRLVTRVLNSNSYLKLLPISFTISKSGDGWLYLVVSLLSLLINGFYDPYFWCLALGFAIERPIYYLLKNTLKRNRPFKIIAIKHHIIPSDVFSFPSGHTSSAFLFAFITSVFFPFLLIPLIIWASLIGFSRIILGVHFPSDIIVGILLGVAVAYFILEINL
jgi:undecaprenyl-diphosphatase